MIMENIPIPLLVIILSVLGTYFANLYLKKKEIEIGLKKQQIDKFQELYSLLIDLLEQNNLLFRSQRDMDCDQYKERLVLWVESFTQARIFYLRNSIVFDKFLSSLISICFSTIELYSMNIRHELESMNQNERRYGMSIKNIFSSLEEEYKAVQERRKELVIGKDVNAHIKDLENIISLLDKKYRSLF